MLAFSCPCELAQVGQDQPLYLALHIDANEVEYQWGLWVVISELNIKELNMSGQRNTCGGDLKRIST